MWSEFDRLTLSRVAGSNKHDNEYSGSIKGGDFLTIWAKFSPSERHWLLYGVGSLYNWHQSLWRASWCLVSV